MAEQYLSQDPNAGLEDSGYISTDPNAGLEPKLEGGIVANALAGAGDVIKGFAQQFVPDLSLKHLATIAYGPINAQIQGYNALKSIVDTGEQIAEAEKTPPFSRERFAAGFNVAGQLGLLAAGGRAPKLAEIAGIEKPIEAVPQTPEPLATEVAAKQTETIPVGGEINAPTQTVQTNAPQQAAGVGIPAGGEVEVPVGAYGKAKVSPEIAQFIGNFGYGRSHLNQFLVNAYKAAEKGDQVGLNKNLRFLRDDLRSLGDEDFRENVQKVRDFFDFDFKPKEVIPNAEQIQGPARADVNVQLPGGESAREVYGGEMPANVGGEGVPQGGQGETLQQTQEVAPIPENLSYDEGVTVNGRKFRRENGFWIGEGDPNFMGGSEVRVHDPKFADEVS